MYGQKLLDAIVPNTAKPFNFQQEYGLSAADVSTYFHSVALKSNQDRLYLSCKNIISKILGRCIIMDFRPSVAVQNLSAHI